MGQQRRRISAEKKVEIVREHLDNKKTISELAEEYGTHPNMITRWKKEFFEGAVETFSAKHGKSEKRKDKKIKKLEEVLQKRDTLIAELVSENIDLKKNIDGDD